MIKKPIEEMTNDELDVLESRIADSIDTIGEAQALIERVRDSRLQQTELPLEDEQEVPYKQLLEREDVKEILKKVDDCPFHHLFAGIIFGNDKEAMVRDFVEWKDSQESCDE